MKFGSDFSWLWVAIIRIFTAPFYIILWCINVVKSAFGVVILWIVSKCCVGLVLFLPFWLLIDILHWITPSVGDDFFRWYGIHVMGFVQRAWIDGAVHEFPIPAGGTNFLPYPHIEIPIMIVLTLLVATVRTIYREEFDEL